MQHLVTYFGNDPERVECALFPARQALHSRIAGEANGWGMGFAHAGDVLLQKRPRAEVQEVDFFGLAKSLRADALVARAGLKEEGRAADNADPFRFRSWLFGALGTAPGFDRVRDPVLSSVPDFLRRNIRGPLPSEHLFHLFLAFLHDAGALDSSSAPPVAIGRALRESVAFVDRLLRTSGGGPLQMAMVATNGRCLLVESNDHPVQFLQIDGIMDCPVCRQKNDMEGAGNDRRFAHEGLRAVIVEAGGDRAPRPGWRALPPHGGLVVGADRLAQITEPTPQA